MKLRLGALLDEGGIEVEICSIQGESCSSAVLQFRRDVGAMSRGRQGMINRPIPRLMNTIPSARSYPSYPPLNGPVNATH